MNLIKPITMRIYIALIFCLLAGVTIQAQQMHMEACRGRNNGDNMGTLFGQEHSFGAFLGLYSSMTRINNQDALMIGGEVSTAINHRLNIGVAGQGLVTDVWGQNLTETGDRLYYEMGYGGLFFEPVFFSKSAIHFTTPVLFGAGGIGESRTQLFNPEEESSWEDPTFYRSDFFLVLEPGVNLEMNLFRHLRFKAGVSYRAMGDVELPNTDLSSIEGWNANLGLRIGWF